MKARSDLWRVQRHEDKARESAYICMAIADYLRVAANDRNYVINWRAGDAGDGKPDGATDVKTKRVSLNRGLLNGQRAPFDGSFVDRLTGIASHEAGHALIASDGWRFNHNAYGDPMLAHALDNYFEDMLIDGASMTRYNAGLGQLTQRLRRAMRGEQLPLALKMWTATNGVLSPFVLANLWAVAHLCRFRDSLESLPHRQQEAATMYELDMLAIDCMNDASSLGSLAFIHGRLENWIARAYAILMGYEQQTREQRQREREQREQQQREQQQQQQQQPDEDADEDEDSDTDADGDSDGDSGDADEDADGDGDSGNGDASGDADEDADGDSSDSNAGDGDADEDGEPGHGEPDSDGDSEPDPDVPVNIACPNDATGDSSDEDADFWRDVKREYDRLFALDFHKRGQRDGARVLAKFTDKRTLEAIRRAYEQLASEPDRRRHLESGRIDRKRLAYSEARTDIFRRQTSRTLAGTLALLLDFSGSTTAVGRTSTYAGEDCQPLIRQVTASVYAALQRTEIKVHAYAFSAGNMYIDGERTDARVVQLASPDRVIDFDRVRGLGFTNTHEAIEVARTAIKPRGDSVMIIVTDGQPDSPIETVERMQAAKADGWKIVLMLVGDIKPATAMRATADATIEIRNYHELAPGMARVVNDIMRGQQRRRG